MSISSSISGGGGSASGGGGSGDVVGPASSTDNALARFNGTGGTQIQDSLVTLSDLGVVFFWNSGNEVKLRVSSTTPSLDIASNVILRFSDDPDIESGSFDTGLSRSAAGVLGLTNGSTGGGTLEFTEIAAPSAPAANKARLFTQDNGAGKTQLVVRFATGAIQVLATEP